MLLKKTSFKSCFSEACAIELDDKVIVTGGVKNSLTVSVYNTVGWVEDLPKMQQGRFDHGCGHFINSNNEMGWFEIKDIEYFYFTLGVPCGWRQFRR